MRESLKKDLKKFPDLEKIYETGIERIRACGGLDALNEVRVALLGRKGELTNFLRGIGSLPAKERPIVGKVVNQVREKLEEELERKMSEVGAASLSEKLKKEAVDVTLPGRMPPVGRKHLTVQIMEEIEDIFIGLGYKVVEGREVELDYYNFTALNTPPDHPARALTDTFYLDTKFDNEKGAVLLRTHTSPVQIHVMENQQPPIYVISAGKTFRRDYDITHTPMFHQVEGFAVDEDITMSDLKGTLERFAKAMFGEDRRVRLRPHYFPFTEPSAEVDVLCIICNGAGCRLCKHSGWLEILGCGMIDPEVFKMVGYEDPENVTGFAFGMGVERIAQLKYGLTDMRMLYENDVRFLRQF